MYAVQAHPASRHVWTPQSNGAEPDATVTTGRTLAGFDVLCPRCEHRGLDLCRSGDDTLLLTCRSCGVSERVNRVDPPRTPPAVANDADSRPAPTA
jgi:hypothetical protein